MSTSTTDLGTFGTDGNDDVIDMDLDTGAPVADVSEEVQHDRNLAALLHLGTAAAAVLTAGFLDIVVPAVAYALFRNSKIVREHAKEQLNFQLTVLVATIAGAVLTFVTFGLGALVVVPALLVLTVLDVLCSVLAALKARRGETYRFPLSIRFFR